MADLPANGADLNPNKRDYTDKIRDAVQGAGNSADDQGDDGADDVEDLDKGKGSADSGSDNHDDDSDTGDDGGQSDAGNGADDANDDDGDAGDGDDKEELQVKLSQFKGDGKRGSYTKNLEQGFIDQAQKLNEANDKTELLERQVTAIRQAATKDPEFGRKLVALLDVDGNGNSGGSSQSSDASGGSLDAEDPFLVDAKTKWKADNDKSTKEFVDANPEVLTDPELNRNVKRLMKQFSEAELRDNKRLMMGGEAMEKAFAYLGLTDKRKANQDLVDGMKGGAAPTRPTRAKKATKSGNKQFSDLTLSFASKMGISQERLKKGTHKS